MSLTDAQIDYLRCIRDDQPIKLKGAPALAIRKKLIAGKYLTTTGKLTAKGKTACPQTIEDFVNSLQNGYIVEDHSGTPYGCVEVETINKSGAQIFEAWAIKGNGLVSIGIGLNREVIERKVRRAAILQ